MLREVKTEKAPLPVGHYSQGIINDNLLFVSGQIPLDPSTNKLVKEFDDACIQALDNMLAVVEAGGSSLKQIINIKIYITDISLFAKFDEIYKQYLGDHRPARAVIGVSELPKKAQIEVEAIAAIKD
ncbi:MAG: Rid family detoxifying hydrolase [Kosmotogaceae bacterium]